MDSEKVYAQEIYQQAKCSYEGALALLVDRTYDRLIHNTPPGKMKEVLLKHSQTVRALVEVDVGAGLMRQVNAGVDIDFRARRHENLPLHDTSKLGTDQT